jgi:hypothetical protein
MQRSGGIESEAIELQLEVPAMFTRKQFVRCFYFLMFAIAPMACSSRAGDGGVYPVRGQVLFQGKPTPGAMVFFYPVAGGPGAVRPHAVVEDDGSFQVSTYKRNDGAPPGKYDVTVAWTKPAHGDNDGDSLIPISYGDPHTSDLHAEVKEQVNDLPPFQLQQRAGSANEGRNRRSRE